MATQEPSSSHRPTNSTAPTMPMVMYWRFR